MTAFSLSGLIGALVAIGVVIVVAVLGWYVYKRYFRPRQLAREILQARKRLENYEDKCDALFAQDPHLADQYAEMKRTRPKLELLNLCSNQSKNLLKRKI